MLPGFLGSSNSKEFCLQCGRPGFDPWVRKIPWRRTWQPTPVFLSGEFHRQRNLVDCSPWGCKELNTTERLTHIRVAYYTMISYLKKDKDVAVANKYESWIHYCRNSKGINACLRRKIIIHSMSRDTDNLCLFY